MKTTKATKKKSKGMNVKKGYRDHVMNMLLNDFVGHMEDLQIEAAHLVNARFPAAMLRETNDYGFELRQQLSAVAVVLDAFSVAFQSTLLEPTEDALIRWEVAKQEADEELKRKAS